ncbi:MAG: fibronectin type III domain-containing protein [Phycisphaerales bacterium]|nr:fibronectin type III domain-containing protein [Phycisphaerales bacterium]
MPDTNPDRLSELLEFAELHAPVWEGVASRINVTAAQAAAYTRATDEARLAYNAVLQIRQQAKVATQRQAEAFATLRSTNSSLLKIIRGFAQNQDSPTEIFQLAQIPTPATPVPFAAPATPTALSASLAITDGGIALRWKATQPAGASGVVYRVERQTGSDTMWALVTLTGSKAAIDTSVPPGTSRVIYRVIAQRGSATSEASNPLEIRFGTGPGEAGTITQVKLAA